MSLWNKIIDTSLCSFYNMKIPIINIKFIIYIQIFIKTFNVQKGNLADLSFRVYISVQDILKYWNIQRDHLMTLTHTKPHIFKS